MPHLDIRAWTGLRLVAATFALVLPALVASDPPDQSVQPERRVALVIGNAAYTRPGEKLVNRVGTLERWGRCCATGWASR
jgi:hypothetical protein